jgi:prephenate dehydrogenase
MSILGVGLLGGSVGLAIRRRVTDCHIVGYGHRGEARETALRCGAVDEVVDDPAQAVRGADLVLLCTPVGVFSKILEQISTAIPAEARITDVGSTKRSVVEAAGRTLPNPGRFVGSHPMAGSEKRGVQFARDDLFDGALCITTPVKATDPNALADVEAFWRLLGMRIVRHTPADHDKWLAEVSHLPHAVAAALVAAASDESLTLAGKGFADLTRIAGGDGALWRDILIDNRDNVREAVGKLKGQIDRLVEMLDKGDAEAVRQYLDAAAQRRSAL